MVLLSVALNFFQTFRSQRAVEQLRTGVAPTATVLRDGNWVELPRRELVPGDIIRLAAGDLVPADARLIETNSLHVQQAALTGESMPVEKIAQDIAAAPQNAALAADASNMVFLGTSVVSGTATALISITGRATAFGDIAVRLATRPPETEFERGIRRFGLLIMRTVFFLVLFAFVISLFHRQSPLDSLLFAVALAVGLTPEFLPMITTVTLAQGASHMAKQKVIVKNLAAIQNFGSMDILCSDKTGTLTSGQMTIPTDNVDESYIFKPRRWDIGLIRDFMIYIGPISSIFDFLTFFIMLGVFHAPPELFHTGWFVESLATQTLVLFIIRTAGNPLRSRPSVPLTITTILVVCIGLLLPFTPLAGPLGFTPLPGLYFLFLAVMTVTYLLLVEVVKRQLMRRLIK